MSVQGPALFEIACVVLTGASRTPGRKAPRITLTDEERTFLERLLRARTSPMRDVQRARTILLAASGMNNREISRTAGSSENTVGKWRRRHAKRGPAGLRDAPRSGRPSPYAAEQKAKVLQKATETPGENGVPITSWSAAELARLAREVGIVGEIHPSTIARWLNEADLQPHRWRYWLGNADPEFDERLKDVTDLYMRARELEVRGIPVFCFDEKTSIQALERLQPDKPMEEGKPTRRAHRYRRHGTTNLLAVFRVGTGQVWGEFARKRPATVVAAFIRKVCESVPDAPEIHFVMEQSSTHWHHEVCKVVAELSGLSYDPKKHRRGAQRKAFLGDSNERIVIHFTPRGASWLDQIEIWFSVLSRKVIARGSFSSIEDLQGKIVRFVNHYDRFHIYLGREDPPGPYALEEPDERVRLTHLGDSRYGPSVRRHTGRWEKTPFSGTLEEVVRIIWATMQHLVVGP